MNIKKKIKSLLSVLPKKDRQIALNLLDKEDFQTLVELVDSDVKIAKAELDKMQEQDEEIIDENKLIISDMQALKVVIQSYIDEEDEFFHSLDTSSRLMEDNFIESEIIDFP